MKTTKLEMLYLAALSMLGFVATDMYLPAFERMQGFFGSGPEAVALSLSVFLAGLAVGQLLWGVLSDRFGHRTALLAGLAVFVAASVAIAFTQAIWQLLTLRALQALGVSAAAVIWQAMVVGEKSDREAQRLFASIMPLVALTPALAPQLGVVLMQGFDWQGIFIGLALMGGGCFLATLKRPGRPPQPPQGSIAADFGLLLRRPGYVGNVLIYSFGSAAFFAFLTGLPRVMSGMGYGAGDIALVFLPQTLAFLGGGYLGKRWVERLGDGWMLKQLLVLFGFASLLLTVVSLLPLPVIWPMLAPFCLLAAANGALYPIAVNRALGCARECPATGAGLQNSIQISVSFAASAAVALFAGQAQAAVGIAIGLSCIGVMLGYVLSEPGQRRQWALPDPARVAIDERES
ncbi:Bcr/CflA family multidrug efflux MFS transporter [Ferrimonas sediminicola]|uniref:Bcr/CflA family efflux transporter n=1 Tax=Ferrimonas sediminicola TaxID=2569538 RepID=A0A4U1BD48_9GAMM|nr:purine nucleoside transporter PunC [Ferrimonas sediminicola]TKB48866.1 Bcr/CflA family multidrug efflux MFS transporter [Ferrimonas sediminicola]